MTRISPDEAYRAAPPLPKELGAVMDELAHSAAELDEHDQQHGTTPAQAASLTGRDYVRAAYLAWQAREGKG